jgi:hypothetical protein
MRVKIKSGFIDGGVWQLKSVINGDRTYLISIPKRWVEVFCKPDAKRHYWVGYNQLGDEITIKAYRGENDSH